MSDLFGDKPKERPKGMGDRKSLRRFECEKHNYSYDRWSAYQDHFTEPTLCPICIKEKLIELGVKPLEPIV